MTHRRIRLGPVPMPLAGLDLHHVTDVDRNLLLFVCDIARAGGHDQDLVAIMRMPSRIAPLAKIHHTAVVIGGFSRRNDGLPGPGNGPRPPLSLLSRAFHW